MMYYKGRHPLLVKCFKSSHRCIRQMGGACCGVCLPIIGLNVTFSKKINSRSMCTQNSSTRVWIPSQNGKQVMQYNERHILLLECFITVLWCMRQMRGAFDSIYLPIMCHTVSFSTQIDSQIAHKIPIFRCHLSEVNGMIYCNKRHPLLMKCFITFLGCIRQMGGASGIIICQFQLPMERFPLRLTLKIVHKMIDFEYPLPTENGMLYYKERHPLLLKCFTSFFRCIMQMGGAPDSNYQSCVGLTVSF